MDRGLYPLKYYDYDSDKLALQRERDIVDDLPTYGPDENPTLFTDTTFPTNSNCMYINPHCPPQGHVLGEYLRWGRICIPGDINGCLNPEYISQSHLSPNIIQGAFGNQYLIDALRMLACEPRFLRQILVSNKYADRGIYTFKFYKAGKWRYVMIDDFIPCHRSGSVYFSRNNNPNETYAMLIEKAYAKLHGCYEMIVHGQIHKVMQELSPAAHIALFKTENRLIRTLCDEVWDLLEDGVRNVRLIGCGRWIPDPYNEHSSVRQGITLDTMYQVVDICIAQAHPTTELDGITIGMICVRNLQKDTGRFEGSWSYGHEYWSLYPDIGEALRQRTTEIQNRLDVVIFGDKQIDSIKNADEEYQKEEDLNIQAIIQGKQVKAVQPKSDNLFWIQIEDFADVFNRIYVMIDQSNDARFKSKRLMSSWIPGHASRGSEGPPYLSINDTSLIIQKKKDTIKLNKVLRKPFLMGPKTALNKFHTQKDSKYKFHGGINCASPPRKISNVLHSHPMSPASNGHETRRGSYRRVSIANVAQDITTARKHSQDANKEDMLRDIQIDIEGNQDLKDTLQRIYGGSNELEFQGSDEFLEFVDDTEAKPDARSSSYVTTNDEIVRSRRESIRKMSIIKPTDKNPSFSFTINDHCTTCITLYQTDRRWSIQRRESFDANTIQRLQREDSARKPSLYRDEVLKRCMMYPDAIGFLIVRHRDKRDRANIDLSDIIASSDCIECSNTSSGAVYLEPGRYDMIPFTYNPVEREVEFVLHFHYIDGALELDTNTDNLNHVLGSAEAELSDEEEVSEKIDRSLETNNVSVDSGLNLPLFEPIEEWEYLGIHGDGGVLSLYSEIGAMAKMLSTLEVDMSHMKRVMEKVQLDIYTKQKILSPKPEIEQTSSNKVANLNIAEEKSSPQDSTSKSRSHRNAFIGHKPI